MVELQSTEPEIYIIFRDFLMKNYRFSDDLQQTFYVYDKEVS